MRGRFSYLIAVFLPVFPLFIARYLPLQDLPAQSALMAVAGDSGLYVQANPFTHSYLYYLIGTLGIHTGMNGYAVAVLLTGVAVSGYVAAVLWLSKELESSPVVAASSFGLTWNHVAVMGFTPFVLSIDAAIAGIALLIRLKKDTYSSVIAAIILSVLTYYLHFMGYLALILGVVIFRLLPGKKGINKQAPWGLLAGLFLFIVYKASTSLGTITGAVFSDPGSRLIQVLLFMGPNTVFPFVDILAGLMGVFVLVVTLRSNKGHVMSWIVVAFCVLSLVLPSYIKGIRLVYPVLRFLPFILGLLFASIPKQPKWRGFILIIMALWLNLWSGYALIHDGNRLYRQAEAIINIPAGHTLVSFTGHWRPKGSVLNTYERMHLPFLYQAYGKGVVIGPYTQPNMPVRLRSEIYAIVEESYKDWQDYLKNALKYGDMVVTDMTGVHAVMNADPFNTLRPCTSRLIRPWSCWAKRRP